jgi:hypothetical protein
MGVGSWPLIDGFGDESGATVGSIDAGLALECRIRRVPPLVRIAVGVILLAACSSPEPTPRPTELASSSPTATVAAADLDEIVVSPKTRPFGLGHDNTEEGPPVLTRVVISGRDGDFLGLEGFTAGRSTSFSGDTGALLSLGLAFATVENAEAAFDLYVDELQSEEGYGFGNGDPVALGDEGVCDEGDNPALDGLRETICIWRNGSLVLIAGGTFAPGAIHDVAEEMDARVE